MGCGDRKEDLADEVLTRSRPAFCSRHNRGADLGSQPEGHPYKSPLSHRPDNKRVFKIGDREMAKVREARVRRMIDRQGYLLEKSRRRDPRSVGYGH